MIYTLTLNPALDYDMYLDTDLKTDFLNQANKVVFRAGGKGINVSKVLKNLEVDSLALGFVGGFVGDFIIEDLKNSSIQSDFLKLDGISRINVKVNGNDIETELTGISPEISEEKIKQLIQKLSILKENDILILSGSIPSSLSKNIYKQISESINPNVEVVLDTRGNLLNENLHNNLLIKPNINELREMFNEKIETKEEMIEKCKYFLNKGVKNIILSRGSKGALLVNKEIVLEASVPKGNLINSIGAGDSMVAGFVAALSKNFPIEEAFKLAVASGSATAYSYGLAKKELIDKLYKEIIVTKENI